MTLTVGSLFTGIGGLDLGLERAGMTIAWQAEIDPYCCRVLERRWPSIPNLGDVKHVDWSTVEKVDLICGGYPCQPFSLAGGRAGTEDPRHLWPCFADALRVLRPRWALLENVPGHLSLGFGRVLGDLAELGFDAEWDCVPAAAVGAPHLRYRVFVVAHAHGDGFKRGEERNVWSAAGLAAPLGDDADGLCVAVADADGEGLSVSGGRPRQTGRPVPANGGWWAAEPDVGRVADGVPSRVDRLRALGNAVVPQVAEWIGRRVLELT